MADWSKGSQVSTVTGSSQKFGVALALRTTYVLSSSVGCWFAVAATGGSAAVGTANSHYMPAGAYRIINTDESAALFVHIIKHTGEADGNACLSQVEVN